jgi:O-antigen ligase
MSQPRRIFLLICALSALCGSLITILGTQMEQREQLRGYVDPTYNPELPFRIPRLGVNAQLSQYSPDELQTHLDVMQQAGVHWVRQFTYWDEIQPEPDIWDWETWDRLTEAFEERNDLELVVVLHQSPVWARNQNTSITAPPLDPVAFASFAQAFAERYGDVIDFYQIWDEPNLSSAWGNLDPQPADYTALLSAAYSAVKAADPEATVISAALAPTTEAGPQNISDWQYLDVLYQLGAADYMDAVAGKPYGFNASPIDRTVSSETLNFSRFVGLREVMERHGDGKTALWGSNWGWNSLANDWEGSPSIWGSVGPEQQQEFTVEALERADREWPWLGGMILSHWQPSAPAHDPIWGFSLLGQDDAPTPLFETLVEYGHAYNMTSASNGLYPSANASAQYSGVWTFSNLGADIGWLEDSRFAFDFIGRDVALLLREGNYVAHLYPQIDRTTTLANALERDASGNPYILLTSNTLTSEVNVVPVARNLPYGQHTLTAVADEGEDQYALVGYAVSDGNLAEPFQRQMAIATLTAVISAFAVGVIALRIDWRFISRPFEQAWSRLSDTVQLGLTGLASVLLLVGMLMTFGRETPALLRREPVQLGAAILTAGILYLNFSLILSILSLVVIAWIFYQRPPLGLATVLFFAPFFLFPVELYRFAFPMSELLLLTLFGTWFVRALVDWAYVRQNKNHPRAIYWPLWNGMDAAILAWVVFGIAAIAWSAQRDLAITDFRTLFLEPALFYLVFRTTISRPIDFQRLIDTLIMSGILVAVIGLVLFARGEAVITAEGAVRRLASVYGSPNNVTLFLGRCIPFTLGFMLISTQPWRRISAGLAFMMMLSAVVLTQSVGGIFAGIPASIAAMILLRYRSRAVLPLLVLSALGLTALILGTSLSPRIARAFVFDDGTNFIRLRLWQSSIHMLQDHPITGLGLDQFLNAYRGQYILPDAWKEPNLSHPHNIVLDYWLRLGIGGVVVLLSTQYFFWKLLLKDALPYLQKSITQHPHLYAIGIGSVGSMVNMLAHGLIDNSIYVLDLVYVFVLICGGVGYLGTISQQDLSKQHQQIDTES